MKGPMRKITERRYYQPMHSGDKAGSVQLTLECGHKVDRHLSLEPRVGAHCDQCLYDQSLPEQSRGN